MPGLVPTRRGAQEAVWGRRTSRHLRGSERDHIVESTGFSLQNVHHIVVLVVG